MITQEIIEQAKKRTRYSMPADVLHEHDDCIRMAYEWLDAQATVKNPKRTYLPLKHIIQKWTGRYISESDVEVAAELHPGITGKYPHFNLSARLTLPNDRRLDGIGEAFAHDYRDNFNPKRYARVEA